MLTPTEWADSLRASIERLASSMREIESMEQQSEWDAYFSAWMSDTSISKDTRKTVKNLLPAVISMAEDIDDNVLSELGINPLLLPQNTPFSENQDIEPKALKIAQIDMIEAPDETAQAILATTHPTRTVMISIYDTLGSLVMGEVQMSEISSGIFTYHIDWSALNVQDGYYIIKVQDGYQMDVQQMEIQSLATQSHTQADKAWMLQNLSGGNGAPLATADGRFI